MQAFEEHMKKNSKIFLALAGTLALTSLTGAVVAQGAGAPPAVAAPAPAPAPVAVVPAPVQATPAAAPAVSPAPAAPVIATQPLAVDTLSDDDLVRRLARLNAQKDVLQAEMSLDRARASRQAAVLESQIKLLELQQQVANGGKKPEAREASTASSSAAAAAAAFVYQAPQPAVRSVYGYGQNAYAEIYVGSDKILATPGTVLSSGHRVVEIGPNGVVLVKNGRRQTLPVRGSAGVQSTPVSNSVPMGLPPAPPRN